jgi:hypothetical protein
MGTRLRGDDVLGLIVFDIFHHTNLQTKKNPLTMSGLKSKTRDVLKETVPL